MGTGSSDSETKALVDPLVMQQIGQLELMSRVVVDGFLAGKHRSTHKGGCCEFAQHRPYAPGDEFSRIDWNVYARSDRYFIRQFEEETNLQAFLALDTSGSMRFGMSTKTKYEFAQTAAACLSRFLLHQRDAVGLAVLTEPAPISVPPRRHASHLRSLLYTLLAHKAVGAGELATQIKAFVPRMKRRGLLIVFSDCFGNVDELCNAFRLVRARGHDLIVFQVLAPEEANFDFRRWSAFHSLENQRDRVRLDPAAVRDAYLRNLQRHVETLQESITGIGGDYVRITTDQELGAVLAHFLRSRKARQARAGSHAGRVVVS
ncbi:MAG: DUF58 domain-containing protein [Planctomycetota bacterium]